MISSADPFFSSRSSMRVSIPVIDTYVTDRPDAGKTRTADDDLGEIRREHVRTAEHCDSRVPASGFWDDAVEGGYWCWVADNRAPRLSLILATRRWLLVSNRASRISRQSVSLSKASRCPRLFLRLYNRVFSSFRSAESMR